MKSATLEEVTEFVTDGTHGSPQRTEDENGVPLLSAKNVFDGEVRWDNFDRVPLPELEEFQKRVKLKRGDVLMTCVGTIGRAAVWRDEKPAVFFRSVAIMRPKPYLLSDYLEYVLRSRDFQTELRRRTKRSSQGGVYLRDIKTMPLQVPPLPEQERIVKLLDEADELRKLRAEADTRTAQLLTPLFEAFFGNPAAGGDNWPQHRLMEVCENVTDGTHDTPERVTFGIPFITSKNIRPYEFDLSSLGYVSEETHNEIIKRCNPRFGDVLYTNIGVGIGNAVANRLSYPFSLKNAALIQPDLRRLDSAFLESLLNHASFKMQIVNGSSQGGAQRFVGLAQLRGIKIPVPPLSLQREFAQCVNEFRDLKAAQAASRRRTEDLFQSMLHKAFNDEL